MTGAEAAGSGNLVMGYCVISGMRCCVLYDSGATHSFVSESCVRELGLPVCELQFDLVVSTPASGLVRTSSVCFEICFSLSKSVLSKSIATNFILLMLFLHKKIILNIDLKTFISLILIDHWIICTCDIL